MKTSWPFYLNVQKIFTILGWVVFLSLAGLVLGRLISGFPATPGMTFMPHGHCYLWNPQLLWLHVISDSVIAASYIAISISLTYLVVRGRKTLPFHWMMFAFAVFIVACGGTHICEVLTVWVPRYWFSGQVKLVTAVASLVTAILLPPLIPKIFALLEAAKLSQERKHALIAAHAELEAAYQKIKELDAVKTAFFSNVSHELRTPLALIFGPVDKLLRGGGLDATQRYNLRVIQRSTLLLHKMVNDLLDLSKLEAGKLAMAYERVDLARLIRLDSAYFESTGEERRIRFLTTTPESITAQVDPEKLQRVVINLISNAFKFTPDGGAITCSLHVVDGIANISVDDSGPGVPEALRTQIFERFAQGGADRETGSRAFGGTGLGLSIVKEFVSMHSGTVSVGTSELGGARFDVSIPIEAPAGTHVGEESELPIEHRPILASTIRSALSEAMATEAAPPSPAAVEDGQSRSSALPKARVLVVEDNPDMNAFVTRILEPEFETDSATNGMDALELVGSRKPDLIVSDVSMPGMSGSELLRRLRTQPDGATIPVILLTAKVDEESRSEFLRAGAQDYITKPFSVDELRARVRNQITAKKARDTLQQTLASQDEDISRLAVEVTRRSRDLKDAKEIAEQANLAKDRFLAILSHELRTPLMPVLTGIVELESDQSIQPDARSVLRVIRRNVEMEARLIDDLLDVTRVAKGKLVVKLGPVDAHELLLTAARQFEAVMREKSQQLLLHLNAEQHWVDGDGPRLLQVFTNLIGNATKFTGTNGQIEMATFNDSEGRMHITISDNGIGISPEALPTLFHPFEQGGELITRKYGGLGLGLAVSKALVEAHSGTISAQSAGGNQGATFTITLKAFNEPGGSNSAHGVNESVPSSPSSRQLRILLVEDHEDTRATLSRLVRRWGYNVTIADSVKNALEIGHSQHFDLLVSDLGLPDGTGMDIIRELRQGPGNEHLLAIAVSGFGMEEDIRLSREAGFHEHLTKPIAVGLLRSSIERLLAPLRANNPT